MFFDSLGHAGKDLVIVLFIIFTIVLSIYIMVFNNSTQWWMDNCKTKLSNDDRDAHGPNTTAVVLASVFVGVIALVIIYSIYRYYNTGKIVGINFGRRYR